MALPEEFLQYPMRRHGMDHDRYTWSNMFTRKAIFWPNHARIALMVTIPVEFFPLNQQGKPFKAPGGMMTQYPDFRHYSSRDYGNRVGIFRIFKALEESNLTANIALNAAVAERYPELVQAIEARQYEILGHGLDMDTLHYGGMDEQTEKEQIEKALRLLEANVRQPIKGWISPAYSESWNTLDFLAEKGIEYVGDWANDDMPYLMKTASQPMISLPISQELSDRQIIINYHHSEDAFEQQICDQFDMLYEESLQYGGRVLSIVVHPYIIGLPYRIQSLARALDYICSHEGVWSAKASEVVSSFKARAAIESPSVP
jgi:allantoinase